MFAPEGFGKLEQDNFDSETDERVEQLLWQ
jgi:hypothetical protein